LFKINVDASCLMAEKSCKKNKDTQFDMI